ncbi:MAG: hypothetical protein ACTSRB_18100 [Candidatus Helarchaeota archaeon]
MKDYITWDYGKNKGIASSSVKDLNTPCGLKMADYKKPFLREFPMRSRKASVKIQN